MDSALKQRLLGAAVLIALAVIFVPMFLTTSPPKSENAPLNPNIPAAPEREFETRNLGVEAPAPGAQPPPASAAGANAGKVSTVDTSAQSTVAPAPDNATASPPAAAPVASTSPPKVPAAAPTPPPAPPPAPATAADGRFLVNLGVYADAAHASALVDKVKKMGYPAFAEATEYQGKSAQRVRVGPYVDRAAAESVRLKIKQADDKVPSNISQTADTDKPVALNAKSEVADKPVSTPNLPTNRAGAYVVQAAALKSEDDANRLRDRLRAGGVAAFVEKSGDGDTTFWKVRAGPFADRGGADAAVATLKQKFQIAAIVKTQP
jgi:DedD protein